MFDEKSYGLKMDKAIEVFSKELTSLRTGRANSAMLDLIKVDEDPCGIENSDYFMENIIDYNTVRQIWVEKNNNKRIIKASAEVYGFPLEAIIIDE